MLILRTLLFVPGNQERRLEKARLIPADAIAEKERQGR
jgi:citrate lyase beta subunit